MIINEDTKSIDVFEMLTFSIVAILNLLHVLSRTEYITDSIVHWVVKQGCKMILVWTNVSRIAIETLTHLEYTSGLAVLTPEIFWNFWNGIDTNTIKVISLDQVLHPVFEVLANPRILLSKIWQVGQSAVFNVTLIVPVCNLAIRVIVLRVVEWVDLREICTDWSNVVSNNINHYPDSHLVGLFD